MGNFRFDGDARPPFDEGRVFFDPCCTANVMETAFGPNRETFGSAQWASLRDLKKAGALSGDGLIVGKSGNAFIRDNNPEGSVLVFAPQGSGKGVGLVIPNLLDYRGTVICTDIKGREPRYHRASSKTVWTSLSAGSRKPTKL